MTIRFFPLSLLVIVYPDYASHNFNPECKNIIFKRNIIDYTDLSLHQVALSTLLILMDYNNKVTLFYSKKPQQIFIKNQIFNTQAFILLVWPDRLSFSRDLTNTSKRIYLTKKRDHVSTGCQSCTKKANASKSFFSQRGQNRDDDGEKNLLVSLSLKCDAVFSLYNI